MLPPFSSHFELFLVRTLIPPSSNSFLLFVHLPPHSRTVSSDSVPHLPIFELSPSVPYSSPHFWAFLSCSVPHPLYFWTLLSCSVPLISLFLDFPLLFRTLISPFLDVTLPLRTPFPPPWTLLFSPEPPLSLLYTPVCLLCSRFLLSCTFSIKLYSLSCRGTHGHHHHF